MERATSRWEQLVNAEHQLFEAKKRFLAESTDVERELARALQRASDRGTALRLLLTLDISLLISLVDDLVRLASVDHSDVALARRAIARIPAAWRESHLWKHVEPLLEDGGEEEYRRLAELLRDLSSEYLHTLVARALDHPDEEVREVGVDFS